jgi:hypothetical protein
LYSLSSAKRAGIPSPSGNNVTALDISGKPEGLTNLESQQVLSVKISKDACRCLYFRSQKYLEGIYERKILKIEISDNSLGVKYSSIFRLLLPVLKFFSPRRNEVVPPIGNPWASK